MKDSRIRLGTAVEITSQNSVRHFAGPRVSDSMPIDGLVVEIDEDHREGQWPRQVRVRFMDGRDGWYNRSELGIINKHGLLNFPLPVTDTPIRCYLSVVGINIPSRLMVVAETIGPEGDIELEAMPMPLDELWNLAHGIVPERLLVRCQVHGPKEM